MGEISEDMLDGSCCELCGQYFRHPDYDDSIYVHENPVVCWDCWRELSKQERKLYQKAKVETF